MRQQGSILILVMFVLIVLSIVALSFTYRVGLETRMARNDVIHIHLEALNRSAVAIALRDLSANTNEFDHPGEPWSAHKQLAGLDGLAEWEESGPGGQPAYRTEYQVVDEDGKLHLLFASSEAMQAMGLTVDQIDCIFDWMDEDQVARSEGAESDFYLSQTRPYSSKNSHIEVLEELLLVKGITPSVYWGEDLNHNRRLDPNENDGVRSAPPDNADGVLQPGLVDLITVLGDGKINLNTAPKAVLQTLSLSEGAVEQIVAYRAFDDLTRGTLEAHAFVSLEDIEQLQGLTDADRQVLSESVKFTSQYYRIHVQSHHIQTGMSCRSEIVVQLSGRVPGILRWLQ